MQAPTTLHEPQTVNPQPVRMRNASLPSQANNTALGARKQPPNQGTIHAASEDATQAGFVVCVAKSRDGDKFSCVRVQFHAA